MVKDKPWVITTSVNQTLFLTCPLKIVENTSFHICVTGGKLSESAIGYWGKRFLLRFLCFCFFLWEKQNVKYRELWGYNLFVYRQTFWFKLSCPGTLWYCNGFIIEKEKLQSQKWCGGWSPRILTEVPGNSARYATLS